MFNSERVDASGNVREGKHGEIEPLGRNRGPEEIDRAIGMRSWTEAEQSYLRWTRSEIIIPVVVRNRVRGAIVGISDRPDALPPDLKIMLLRSTKTAQLWYELGELHERAVLSDQESGRLPGGLASAPKGRGGAGASDAGLAAILTADCGLGWHRA